MSSDREPFFGLSAAAPWGNTPSQEGDSSRVLYPIGFIGQDQCYKEFNPPVFVGSERTFQWVWGKPFQILLFFVDLVTKRGGKLLIALMLAVGVESYIYWIQWDHLRSSPKKVDNVGGRAHTSLPCCTR